MRQDTFSYGIDTVLIPIRYGQIRILLPIITDFSSVPVFFFFDNYQSLARTFRALVIIHVQIRTLRIRYESLLIGRINTEALSAASAASVSASVT